MYSLKKRISDDLFTTEISFNVNSSKSGTGAFSPTPTPPNTADGYYVVPTAYPVTTPVSNLTNPPVLNHNNGPSSVVPLPLLGHHPNSSTSLQSADLAA